ncbi:MAG TPA: type II toxin-antitoxin system Phd/YefM family antitoxin [Nocardioidaceae bacterium]
MTEISAREFNRDVSAAKRAAEVEAVVITDHGRPSHVLLSYAEYERITGTAIDLAEWLALDVEIVGEQPLDLGLRVPDL